MPHHTADSRHIGRHDRNSRRHGFDEDKTKPSACDGSTSTSIIDIACLGSFIAPCRTTRSQAQSSDFIFNGLTLRALAEDLEMDRGVEQLERFEKIGDASDRIESADESNDLLCRVRLGGRVFGDRRCFGDASAKADPTEGPIF